MALFFCAFNRLHDVEADQYNWAGKASTDKTHIGNALLFGAMGSLMRGLLDRAELNRIGPAAVEPLLSALDTAETRQEASQRLLAIPAAIALEPLLHLLGRARFRQAAKAVLFSLEKRVVENALRLLLGEAVAGGQAFATARRCLDYLWPETRDLLFQLSEASGQAAPLARRYLAAKEPLSQQEQVRTLYPCRQEVVTQLHIAKDPRALIRNLVNSRPWLSTEDYGALWEQFHGDIVVGCLLADGTVEQPATAMLTNVGESASTLVHVVQSLALPECRANAIRLLDGIWAKRASKIISLWPTYPDPERAWFQGLLENYLSSKGAAGYERIAARLDNSDIRDQAAHCLAVMGIEVIPALGKVAELVGYSKGVLSAVDLMLAEVVAATLSVPALATDGLKCLRVAQFAANEFTGPVESILYSQSFDTADWCASVRRSDTMLGDSATSPSFRHAIQLCCGWDVTPSQERYQLLSKLQTRIGKLLNWCGQVYQRELADVNLTAQHMVVEPRGKWYIKPPAAPEIVASRLTPELRERLHHIRNFLTYICQARMFGEVKDFATETLKLLPS